MKEVKKLGLKPYLPEKDMGNLLIEMAYESVERLFDKVLGRPLYNEKYYQEIDKVMELWPVQEQLSIEAQRIIAKRAYLRGLIRNNSQGNSTT